MPHKTGIEETETSFKKNPKTTTLREQILYTYHRAEQINEKEAFLLLRIADELEKLEPEVVDVAINNLETRLLNLETASNNLAERLLNLEQKGTK